MIINHGADTRFAGGILSPELTASVCCIQDASTLMKISIGGGAMYALCAQMLSNKHPLSADGTADAMYFREQQSDPARVGINLLSWPVLNVAAGRFVQGWFGLAIAQSAALQAVYFQTSVRLPHVLRQRAGFCLCA